MEYIDYPRFVFPNSYPHERNASLYSPYAVKPETRLCPMSTSNGSYRPRGQVLKEEESPEVAVGSRRRIAVACARCRKRKIRCSGDPGDGSGCHNCKLAGVEFGVCQFNRVNSGDPTTIITAAVLSRRFDVTNVPRPNAAMSPYNSQSISFCPTPRTVSNGHFPAQIETKSVHPYTWNITSSGESSPVDNYNGNHHAYMQNHPSWEQQGKAYNTASTLIPGPDFDTICDQAQARLRAVNARVTATGPLSPLNLTSIQSALPSPMKQFYNSPQRQSPIPLRKAGHHTDALQAQRLQASEDIYGLSKPNMGWHPELVIRDAPSGLPPSATPTTLAPQQSTTSSATQGSTLPYASLSPPENPASTTQPQLTFHTSLMDILTIPTVSVPNYSHFRNHSIPTSSSADNMSVLAEQPSQPNLYCFDSDSKVTAPSNSATEAILVSGQPYTPLLTPPNESKQAASSSGQDAQIRVSTKPSLACRL